MTEILVLFWLSEEAFTKRLEYGCVLYSFEACDTEISNMHLCVKYLNFAILLALLRFLRKTYCPKSREIFEINK